MADDDLPHGEVTLFLDDDGNSLFAAIYRTLMPFLPMCSLLGR